MTSDFDGLFDRTVERLRAATAARDAIVVHVAPNDAQTYPSDIDQAWRDVKADLDRQRPALRAVEVDALDALRELYDLREDLTAVHKAIEQSGADWVEHAIFARALESIDSST